MLLVIIFLGSLITAIDAYREEKEQRKRRENARGDNRQRGDKVPDGGEAEAKGLIQFDLTAEAPTVDKATEILGTAMDRLVVAVRARGFDIIKA